METFRGGVDEMPSTEDILLEVNDDAILSSPKDI